LLGLLFIFFHYNKKERARGKWSIKGKINRVKIILWKIPETETRTGDLTP